MPEILVCLQPNKLACRNFMVAEGRHKTPGSETKDFITLCTPGSRSSTSASGAYTHPSPPPQSEGKQQPSGCCTQSSSVSQMRTLRAQSIIHANLIRGLLATLTNLWPRGKCCLYYPDSKQICPLPKGETISLFQGCLL